MMTVVFYMKQTTGNSWCRITEEITESTKDFIAIQINNGDKWINFYSLGGVEYYVASENISHFGFMETDQ